MNTSPLPGTTHAAVRVQFALGIGGDISPSNRDGEYGARGACALLSSCALSSSRVF